MTTSTNPGTGAPPSSAGFCAACGAALSAEARFCHRCGAPRGHELAVDRTPTFSMATALPWGIAVVALAGVVAVLSTRSPDTAGTAMDRPEGGTVAPFAGQDAGGAAAPDIASMTPSERASRLYVRVMEYAEAGKSDSVAMFAPMVLAAHQMLERPTADERYHFGRVAEVVGSGEIVGAQADTILADRPTSLLGLLLAARAARLAKNETAAKALDARLLAALERELATRNADYENHRAEIDQAVADARRPK